MVLTGAIAYLDDVQTDVLEKCFYEFGTNVLTLDAEANRVNALVKDVKSLSISLFRVFNDDVLTNVPLVVVLVITTYKGELSRHSLGSLEVFQVFTTIEGLYVEPFVCSPHESFLEVGPLQVNFYLVQPLLSGGRNKLGKEFFFV